MNDSVSARRSITAIDGMSPVAGADDTPISTATFAALSASAAEHWSSRPAVVLRQQKMRWNWAQFVAEANRLAAGLLSLGLMSGDRLGTYRDSRESSR